MTAKKKRTPQDLRATAYHEAGHAVANIAQGLTIDTVSIIPGKGYHGMCISPSVWEYDAASTRERRAIGRMIIIGCYAGMHAQRIVEPGAKFGAEGDEHQAFQASRKWCVLPRYSSVGDDAHLKYLGRLKRESRRLVNRHRDAIAALAKELLRKQELDEAAAKAIVEPLLNN